MKVEAPVMTESSLSSHTLTEKQFAEFVGLSGSFVRQLRLAGRIPFVRVNTKVLYLKTDALEFLRQHRQALAEVAA
jgi:hypothetical protein